MSKDILVIGNGFDLYHGLETSYKNFVDYTIKSEMRNNMFVKYFNQLILEGATWIDCEQEIQNVVSTMICIMEKVMSDSSPTHVINIREYQECEKLLITQCENIFVASKEHPYYRVDQKYYSSLYGLQMDKIFKVIKDELDVLITTLEEYLINYCPVDDVTVRSPQIEKLNLQYVISFNYTDTYKLYGIDESQVFHIHGKLNSKPNNMVLGFDDDNEKNLDTIYFKKYFQRIQKRTGLLDESKLKKKITVNTFTDDKIVSHFFGMSMGDTDGDMIRRIEEGSDRCVVYYISQSDYEAKIINMIGIFGKNEFIKKFQSGKIEMVEIE